MSCSVPAPGWLVPTGGPLPGTDLTMDSEPGWKGASPPPTAHFLGPADLLAINQQSHSIHKINFLPNIYKTFSRRSRGPLDQSV